MKNVSEIIEFALNYLQAKLPDGCFYHSVEHTRLVINSCREMADYYQLSTAEKDILLTAAAFHDLGFTEDVKHHEESSAALCVKYLGQWGFDEREISNVEKLILITKRNGDPKDLLSQIISDADLSYLGNGKQESDFWRDALYREISFFYPQLTREKWGEIELDFMKNLFFYTSFAREKYEPGRQLILAEYVGEREKKGE
ncbi:MAG: HD domain-containing protein [Victivallaceae bacterium]